MKLRIIHQCGYFYPQQLISVYGQKSWVGFGRPKSVRFLHESSAKDFLKLVDIGYQNHNDTCRSQVVYKNYK